MNKVRILYVIGSSNIGGAENFVFTLLRSLNNAKFEKYVVCPAKGYYAQRFKAFAKKVLFINPERSFMNPGTILRVSRFIKDNNIDITHTMLYTSDFCSIIACWLTGRSCVLNTINGFNFLVLEKASLRLKRRLASFIYRFIYRYSDKLVAVSEAVRQDLINRKGIKVGPEKIETILAAGTNAPYYNFSEEDINCLRTKYLTGSELIISAIGTLNEMKDYDTMLEAFSLVANKNFNIKLLIAGDGPEKERLKKKALKLNLRTKVHFLGALKENGRNAVLYLSDMFIISSRSEGCPTSLLEALYFGKPIVATKVGGVPEIVNHNETGLLVPARDPALLAEAILNLAQDKEKRVRFGKKGREIFEHRFTQRHMLGAYEDIYNRLFDRSKRKNKQRI